MVFEYLIGGYFLINAYKQTKLFLFRRKLKKHSYKIIKGAEPFFIKGGKVGVILIHGFGQTPAFWREYSPRLKKQGYTVYAPLLTGHGTSPEHLCISKLNQWEADVDNAIQKVRKVCDKVVLVGLSFGGNLAMLSASNNSVDGVVLISTPIYWHQRKRRTILFYIARQIKLFQKKRYFRNLDDYPSVRRYLSPKYAYNSIPLTALAHCMRGVKKSEKVLSKIRSDILIMQSKTDIVVDSKSAEHIYKSVSSKKREIKMFEKAYHSLIVDDEAPRVYGKIDEFLANF